MKNDRLVAVPSTRLFMHDQGPSVGDARDVFLRIPFIQVSKDGMLIACRSGRSFTSSSPVHPRP